MKNLKLIIALFLFTQLNFAQERVVFGVVKDNTGIIPGVNVVIKGTQRKTQTDFNGKYSIQAKAHDTLVFSFPGCITQSIRATQSEINVLYNPYYLPGDYESSYSQGNEKYLKKPSKKELRIARRTKKTAKRDLKNKDNPKYNFKKSLKKSDVFIIYLKDNPDYEKDWDFEHKYHVIYSVAFPLSKKYAEAYNKLVFKQLNKKYKKDWQSEIRKDAIGIDDFL
jgi:hypothetical protein